MRRLPLILLGLPLVLLAASCGGGGGGKSVSKDNAAVVNGTPISRSELDSRIAQAQCSYKIQKRTFPSAGSQEYQTIEQQILQNLVQRAELAQQAPKLNVSVTAKQVEDQLTKLKKQYFGGNEKRYQQELKRQCVSDAQVHADLRANLVSDAIYRKLTAGVKVSDTDVKQYYDTHVSTYVQPETRVVRHILVKDKKLADKLYAQLQGGADFATLAKKYSQDPGSKKQGGQLTISKGQTVPEFDKTAFSLKTGETSKPVHTQYGWHIIQALKPATARKATPFNQVKASIRQQLIQQRSSGVLQAWLNGLRKQYASKVSYATGLAPPATSTSAAPTTTG